jgi:nucleotide-binding universal stress UspA family protein
MKRILVPIDFSGPSLHALEYAVDLAKSVKAELSVCFVVEPIYYAVPDISGEGMAMAALMDDQRRSAVAQLAELQRRYAKRGVKLATSVVTGVASEAIGSVAKKVKTDLIVIATHGRTGLSHLLMGSVAERVVRTAPCPVLTVRAKAAARRSVRPRQSAAPKRRAAGG